MCHFLFFVVSARHASDCGSVCDVLGPITRLHYPVNVWKHLFRLESLWKGVNQEGMCVFAMCCLLNPTRRQVVVGFLSWFGHLDSRRFSFFFLWYVLPQLLFLLALSFAIMIPWLLRNIFASSSVVATASAPSCVFFRRRNGLDCPFGFYLIAIYAGLAPFALFWFYLLGLWSLLVLQSGCV